MSECEEDELVPGSDASTEESGVLWETEYISVNKFPAGFLFIHGFIVKFHVTREIVLEDTEENDG